MADQFGEEVSHTDLDGKWTVMMVADRQGSTFSSELGAYLESGLSPLYPDMVFMAVANLEGAPRLIRSLIRKGIRRSNKTPVLLDWRGIFQASYPLSEQSVDVFFIQPLRQPYASQYPPFLRFVRYGPAGTPYFRNSKQFSVERGRFATLKNVQNSHLNPMYLNIRPRVNDF